ncbi:SDR family NAD(P)-dependent oxidoreductase [Micromonospora sp. PTRAS2]
MQLGLADRVVLVTGAASGIGRATAEAFAAAGARVALTYNRNAAQAEALAAELGGAGRALALPYDIAAPDDAPRLVQAVTGAWGGVDVLVANALRRGRRRGDELFEQFPAAEWQGLLKDNLHGTVRLVQAVLPAMRSRRWGRIALVSSHVTVHGQRGQEIYAAGKSALHGLARSLAWDTGPHGILVNVLSPGLTSTDGVLANLPEPVRLAERSRTATGRLSTPGDVAAVAVFLCSAANGNLTGENITVSGGR